jgi:hypothetical protein
MRSLLLLAFACHTPDAVDQRPPPAAPLHLSAPALQPSAPFTLFVRGAVPGETVHFARASAVGAGPCLPAAGGQCLDLAAPASRLGSAVADTSGEARLTLAIPAVPLGLPVAFQALAFRGPGGAASALSNPVRSVVSGPASPPLNPGDLVLSELHLAPVAAPGGVWFELHNPTAAPLDLDGVLLEDGAGGQALIDHPLIVAPGGWLVVGATPDDAAGVWPDLVWPGLTAPAAGGSLSLTGPAGLLDEVTWAAHWPFTPGASLALSADALNPTDNDAAWRWCPSTAPFGPGDLGTPSGPNAVCATPPPNDPPTAALSCPATIAAGGVAWIDATASSDPDGAIVSYHFDLGDGDARTDLDGAFMHTFTAPGQWVITVTATDDRGGTDTATCLVDVTPRYGVAVVTAGVSFSSLSSRNFSFIDVPPAVDDNSTLTWRWLAAVCPAYGGPATSQIRFAYGGSYTAVGTDTTYTDCVWETASVRLDMAEINDARSPDGLLPAQATASDGCHPGIGCSFYNDPLLEQVTMSVRASRPGALLACPATATAGQPVTLDGSASFAAFGDLAGYAFTDGGAPLTSGIDDQPSFSFATPGPHVIVMTVTDSYGLTESDSCVIEVQP